MHNKNYSQTSSHIHNDFKPSHPSYDSSKVDNPAFLPEKAPPFKATRHKPTYVQTSISERPESLYPRVHYSDNIKNQVAIFESISYDDPVENRRLSKWPHNQRDLQHGPSPNNDSRSSGHGREKVSSKTLPAYSGSINDAEKSKSHSRTRSNLNRSKEGSAEVTGQKDYVSPRFRKAKTTTVGRKSKSGKRKEISRDSHTPTNLREEMKHSGEERHSGGKRWATEKFNPKKLLSPNYEDKGIDKGTTSRKRREKESPRGRKAESRSRRPSHKVAAFEDDVEKSYENRSVRDSGYYEREYRDEMSYGYDYSVGESRERFRQNSERSRILEEEVIDRERRLAQMERFQDQLYQNYVEMKGELERSREENKNLVSDINYYIGQSEGLRRKLGMMEHQEVLLVNENERLKEEKAERSEMISNMEGHIGRLQSEVTMLTKKCNELADSLNAKIGRIEREKQGILYEKERLEKILQEHEKSMEIRGQEDRGLLIRNLDEKSHQIKELRERNERLVEDMFRMQNERDGLLKKQRMSERELMGTGKYGPEIYEPKRLLERTLTQGKYENSPEMYNIDMRRSRADTDKGNDVWKLEGKSTLRRTEDLEVSVEKMEGSAANSRKIQKSLDFGELSRIMKEIVQELGVEDIHEAAKKIRDIQEGNRTDKKFMSAILDLVYKCSPRENSGAKPTTRQAWKWLQKLMEEYMILKKQKGQGGGENMEKEILKSLSEILSVNDTRQVVEKVKNLASENAQMKGVIDKLRAGRVEHSFGIGEVEKLIDKHGTNYASSGYSYNTASFGELSKQGKSMKELSFGRTAGPKLKKMMNNKELHEVPQDVAERESDS